MAGGEARVNYQALDVVVKNDAAAHEARVNYQALDVIVENHPLVQFAGVAAASSSASGDMTTEQFVYASEPAVPKLVVCSLSARIVLRGGAD